MRTSIWECQAQNSFIERQQKKLRSSIITLNAIKNSLDHTRLNWKVVLPVTGLKQKTYKTRKTLKNYYYFSNLRRFIVVLVYCFGVLSFADQKKKKPGVRMLIAISVYFLSLCARTNSSLFSNWKLFYVSPERTRWL